ncbi:MAG: type II secretion system GspH family protein [Candidatus Parcubacteria bacterium]|nr:type II secretion system GspH family protein [Candidatus Parcubacteria bacterium]
MTTRLTRGFSLIEVTVAVAIIGTMIVATSALLQRLPVSGREVRDQDIALKIARNEIEVLRAGGYDALPASGAFANSLLSSLASGSASVTIAVYDPKTKRADVAVSWTGTGSVTRSVLLTTLIAQNSGL